MEKLLLGSGLVLIISATLIGCRPHIVSGDAIEVIAAHLPIAQAATTPVLTGDAGKGSEFDRLQENKKILLSLSRIFDQSHQVFTESTKLLVKSGSVPQSIFHFLSAKFHRHIENNNILALRLDECPMRPQILEIEQNKASPTLQIKLLHGMCLKDKGRDQDFGGGRNDVATLFWSDKSVREFQLILEPSSVPEIVGDSVAILNRKITCYFKYNLNDRLEKMNCTNLGYGLTRASHIQFEKFEYDFSGQEVLNIEADRYQNLLEKIGCQSPGPCLKMKVPLAGKIQIVEDRRMKDDMTLKSQAIVAQLGQAQLIITNGNDKNNDVNYVAIADGNENETKVQGREQRTIQQVGQPPEGEKEANQELNKNETPKAVAPGRESLRAQQLIGSPDSFGADEPSAEQNQIDRPAEIPNAQLEGPTASTASASINNGVEGGNPISQIRTGR